MATITTRSGKGAPLTNAEVDANFNNLNSDKLETSAVSTFGASLIDDADAAAARTTMGLGTAATTDSTDYATAAQGSTADSALQPGDAVPQTGATGSAEIPAGTEAQRDAVPAAGYFRFNSDVAKFEGYNGSAWGSVGGGATGGGADEIFIQNGQTVTTNYTIPADKNAMSTGPITINSGVTVTVSTGARYVVI
jgi:hypothetical protein